jgi:ribosome recycling factor
LAKKEAEEGKIAVRKIRQDINTKIKKAEKDKEISEDDMKKFEKQVQDLTDKTIALIDDTLARKEKEITTV